MTSSEPGLLPPILRTFFDGTALESKVGTTALLVTASAAGRPHLAMLSAGELLATSDTSLHLALHRNSGTGRAVAETGQCLLSVVLEGVAYQLLLHARAADVDDPSAASTAYFRAEIEECKEERAPYARLTSGITFELVDPPSTLALWSHKLDVLARL
jgi:flavin reductase (DIM6/NTAB) family NADH-FMN oxidoreductase RutF